MSNASASAPFEPPTGLAAYDRRLCIRAADAVEARVALALLRLVSRFGDWPLSVTTGVLFGIRWGGDAMMAWAAVAMGAVVVQKGLKRAAGRPRPCQVEGGPAQRAPIPDAGSFPSGHTLHAVMAAVAVGTLVPSLATAFVLLAVLLGLSRVALGVHYPSDVLAGAVLGAVAGWAFLLLVV